MDKKGYTGPIISALLGGVFFAVPYLALNVSLLPSVVIAGVAFTAGNLLFSEDKNKLQTVDDNKNLYEILNEAKKQNSQIYSMINKLEDKELISDVKEIHETVSKIIDTVSKNPKKLDKIQNFFSYYLPVTLKILIKYDDIENQRLISKDSKEFMDSTEAMVKKISKSFKIQLSNLYQSDIIDTDAEMKVFQTMLNADGINDKNDFDIK